MSGDWHQTEQIVMSVQTAELRQAGVADAPELHLSCSLVSIARGQCQLVVSRADSDTNCNNQTGVRIGSLLIEVNRPMMRGAVPADDFDDAEKRYFVAACGADAGFFRAADIMCRCGHFCGAGI